MLKNTSSRLRLKIAFNADNAKALTQFDRKQADLAVLRTDAKVPPRARALAILEHDVLLLIGPGNKKIKSLADLKKTKKIAVLGDGDNVAFVGSIFAGIYTKITRIAPEKASELATAILDIGERIEHTNSLDALEALQDELEPDEIRLGRDDGPFFFSCLGHGAARVPRARAILLCMGLFSRFCIQALRYTAEQARRHVGDTRSLVLRAYGESIQLQAIVL